MEEVKGIQIYILELLKVEQKPQLPEEIIKKMLPLALFTLQQAHFSISE